MTGSLNHHELPYLFEDDLIARMLVERKPVMACYSFPGTALVLGRGSQVFREIHAGDALVDGITLYRRKGGGCSVLLDRGNLILSLAFPVPGILKVKELFNHSNEWLLKGLYDSGIHGIYQDGISDLVISGRKIAGTSFYRSKGIAYYTAAILVSPDITLMEKYLKHPPREPVYRKGRSHSDFVLPLSQWVEGLTPGNLKNELIKHLNPEDLVSYNLGHF